MNPASIAAAFIASQVGQLQTAAAATFLKMNAQAATDGAKLLESAAKNFNSLANVASGIGQSLDISV